MANEDLSEETKEKISKSQDELVKIISSMTSEKELHDFFECLLTPAERFDLGKRWLLVKNINEGRTQRDIAKEFKMSLCKITRGSRELKKEGSAFRKVLDNYKQIID